MPTLKYRGDQSAAYVHKQGTGLVGKVVGPTPTGDYFVVTQATYEADSDTTFATAMKIRRPEVVAEELLGDEA